MIKVIEKFMLDNGMAVLVCEKFNPEMISSRLLTENGIIEFPDFEVSRSKGCFSTPKTCDIVIKKRGFDISRVSMVKFA